VGKQDDKEAKWPGFPERLRQAFRRAGYWKNDRPDVMRYVAQHGIQHGIHVSYAYKYINGETVPDRERLIALAAALDVRPWWLLFGDEAIGGGSRVGQAPAVEPPMQQKKSPTKARGGRRSDSTLWKVRKFGAKAPARRLPQKTATTAHTVPRRTGDERDAAAVGD